MSLSGGPLPEAGADGKVRPYWPVALALFGVAAVLLVSGFLYIRQSRTRVGVASQPASSVAALPSVAPPVTSGGSQLSAPPSVASVAPSASATGPLAQEVADAYQHYWQVYSDALLNLDVSHISEVATGDEATRIQAEIEGIRKQNQAVRVVVKHNYFVFDVNGNQAKVYDEITDGSYTVDRVTKQSGNVPSDTNLEKDTYYFERVNGGWRVTKSTRQRGSA